MEAICCVPIWCHSYTFLDAMRKTTKCLRFWTRNLSNTKKECYPLDSDGQIGGTNGFKKNSQWDSWPGFEASSVCCPWLESLHECQVVFRPVLSTEYLNGNSRRDTGVVKVPAVRRWWRIVRGSHLIPSGDNAFTSNRLTHFLPMSGVHVVRVERWRAC
jgi:hypothetical protein